METKNSVLDSYQVGEQLCALPFSLEGPEKQQETLPPPLEKRRCANLKPEGSGGRSPSQLAPSTLIACPQRGGDPRLETLRGKFLACFMKVKVPYLAPCL